ncbi:MAG: murein biosynthesis integral membrane protein MurJ [Xanthomonadaceae bacterium]|nr:murein biosynthesis integral membrane protein MurJ [Xanthomonadaceae bacterium]
MDQEKLRIEKSAGAMGIATLMSRVLGLVREQVFAHLFGASHATDAFNIAFRIPNLLRDLFAEGAMSAAFVPTFLRVKNDQGDKKSWRIAGLVFRVLFLFVSVLTILGVFFADPLVSLYASAYRAVPGKFELTVLMTKILFPFFPLVALAAAFMAILNACGVFFIPAFSSAIFNLVSIVTGVIFVHFAPGLGFEPIIGMSLGVVFGGAAQAFMQMPELYKVGYRWSKKTSNEPVWYREPALKRMMMLMVPGTMGLAATQINILVNSVLATSQGAGAVSWLNYSFRLMQFPIGVFGVSLASATLPAFSRAWVKKDYNEATGALTRSLRRVLAINLPAAAGLAFLGVPIIQLIFEHGKFTHEDTLSTAHALAAYAVGLAAYSSVKVFVPLFYALDNTRIPVISSVLSVVLNLILNLVFLKWIGFLGLPLSTSLTAIFNLAFLWIAMKVVLRKHGVKWSGAELVGPVAGFLLVSLLMGIVCSGFDSWLITVVGGSKTAQFLRVGLDVTIGVSFVFFIGRIFGFKDETQVLMRLVKRIFKHS